MIRINSPFGKAVSVFSTFTLVFCMVPSMAWAKTVKDTQDWVKSKLPEERVQPKPSKILSAATMKIVQGKTGENPYAAGQSKWDVTYKGVNLLTGNYSLNVTDLAFEGGYGIPVDVARSYSANNAEDSPFGKGWTLSADVRTTSGGVMKSGSLPIRAVPTNFKERPSLQVDPNAITADGSQVQPITAVTATDSGGQEETIQRDADGILSTPPWDKNKIDSTYETIVGTDGTDYQVMTHNVVNTPEGTVYIYDKQGAYDGLGEVPFDQTAASPEPSNVLKMTSATDRNGNSTTYTYDQSSTVHFLKSNGYTTEHPLTKVHMPNGHEINFVWGSGSTVNRIVEVNDGVRRVYYGYSSYTTGITGYSGPYLTSVTTPGGKVTTMTYAVPSTDSNWSPREIAGPVLRTVTDPRGLTTTLYSAMRMGWLSPFSWGNMSYQMPSVTTYRIAQPNGVDVWFARDENGAPDANPPSSLESGSLAGPWWVEIVGGITGTAFNHGYIRFATDSNTVTVMTDMAETDMYGWSGSMLTFPGACSWKQFDSDTQNLISEHHSIRAYVGAQSVLNSDRKLHYSELQQSWSDDTTSHNFMGNPLEKVHSVSKKLSDNSVTTESSTASYSYWGSEKFYQKKATKDAGGRYEYTDFYDKNASQGKKGMTYKIYDAARTTFYEDTSIPIPDSVPACPSSKYWKYRLKPVSDTYSAKFDYDSKGRPIDIWNIKDTNSTPWNYVRTNFSYGSDSDGSWGAAYQVVEDYGGINRTTSTLQYDTIGRSVKTQDASGKQIHTTYDLDGVIQSIEKLSGSTSTPLMTYTYGTTGVTNGVVLSITDNLSGVSQAMTYATSGIAVGAPTSIVETNGGDTYTVGYSYNSVGDRDIVTYTTQSGLGLSSVTKWKYSDYVQVGEPTETNRVFSTMTALDSTTGAMTNEQYHYVFDTQGRLTEATYAMTPQTWSPSGGASFYDHDHPAATRGRTHYQYDANGRVGGVYHWWDSYNSGTGTYSSAPVRANECVYETSGLKRGLKTQSKFYNVSSGSWNLQRTETFGYDANLDYLTSANYGDGLSNATPSWTYDAAGNRVSDSTNSGTWTYDNLNRMTASPGHTYDNDILGNRLSDGPNTTSQQYVWDDLNRMTRLHYGVNNVNDYVYRADGMRISKTATGSASSQSSTLYRYDGNMGVEDVDKNSSGAITSITRTALGARGIDAISRTTSSGTSVTYPLFDAHGNNIGMLSKSGSSWSLSDERSYDAWGQVRSGSATGDQKGRYCASTGHKQDDESGLIYMRARYLDSKAGRFISEDPDKQGYNCYLYCSNQPVSRNDPSGKGWEEVLGRFGWVYEFLKGLDQLGCRYFLQHKDITGKDIFKVAFKTAWGVQEGLVTKWAIQAIQRLVITLGESIEASMASGAGALAVQDEMICAAYSMLLILFIDAIDIGCSDSLADIVADKLFGKSKD